MQLIIFDHSAIIANQTLIFPDLISVLSGLKQQKINCSMTYQFEQKDPSAIRSELHNSFRLLGYAVRTAIAYSAPSEIYFVDLLNIQNISHCYPNKKGLNGALKILSENYQAFPLQVLFVGNTEQDYDVVAEVGCQYQHIEDFLAENLSFSQNVGHCG